MSRFCHFSQIYKKNNTVLVKSKTFYFQLNANKKKGNKL